MHRSSASRSCWSPRLKRSASLWHYGSPIDLPLDDALDAVINQIQIERSRSPDAEGEMITKIHDQPAPESRGQCWRKQSHAAVKSSPCLSRVAVFILPETLQGKWNGVT